MNSNKKNNLPKNSIDDATDDNRDFKMPNKGNSKSKTPILDTYSRDLTDMAQNNKLDPIVGREEEIERVSQILSRRKKNNPILIGEPGCGKSSIGDGIALRIANRKVSRTLFDKRIVMLDIASMVAGTKYRGQFEERIKSLMTELEKNKNVILFVDEIHTIIGAGGASGSLDASNMFKPALARGEIQMIGATTLDEYRKHIEKDGALERRFQKVNIEPSSIEETYEILNSIKSKYEEHHNVSYTDDSINACVDLTTRYMTDRFLPDKAIDALDEAGSRVHIANIKVPKKITDLEAAISKIKEKKTEVIRSQKFEEAAHYRDKEKKINTELDKEREKWEEESKKDRKPVTQENVAQVVSMITGVPVNKVNENENKKLINMDKELSNKIIGQKQAVDSVVQAIQRGRIGMNDENKPLFSGILIGNSGVGKCFTKDTLVNIRNKNTGIIEKISISDLISNIENFSN